MNAASSAPPLVSAIVPVYNGAPFLAVTLRSALAAGFPNLELIVIDDGSTDASIEVAASFGSAVQIASQQNAGVAAARNHGLKLARGEIIAFVDQDDLWAPALAHEALPLLLADHGPDIVQGRLQQFRGDGEEMSLLGPPYESINLGSALYRRQVFEKVGMFDEALSCSEDYDWYLRAFDLRIRKQRLAAVTLFYRIHAASLTASRGVHEIGMARAHKKAAQRRRLNPGLIHVPQGFPSLVEYIGPGRVRGQGPVVGDPGSEAGGQGGDKPEVQLLAEVELLGEKEGPVLARLDQRPIDLPAGAILAFMVVRNEAARLVHCLEHHRRLGVSRFFIVDNDSDDGTRDWLLQQPDVHLWRASASFATARCGTDWTEALLRTYGQGRWCLVLDADELLVYPDCESRPLAAFCQDLEQAGYQAALAIMIDMYSGQPLRQTVYQAGQPFLEVCPFFDRQVYHHKVERFYDHDQHPSLFGGVRRRVFGGQEPGQDERYFYCLNKTPLLKYDPAMTLSDNLHWLRGAAVAVQAAGLLHFKFFADFVAQAEREAQRQEHWAGAVQYARYAEILRQRPDLSLFDPAFSLQYEGSRQLVDLGVLAPVGAHAVRPDDVRPVPGRLTALRSLIKARKTQEVNPYVEALALLKEGKPKEAEVAWRAAIAQEPDFPWSHHYLGDALMMQQRWSDATAAYGRAIELNPHHPASHANLGEVYAHLQQWPEAIACFRRALELQPDLPNAARSLARALARQARTLEREAQVWYDRAQALNPADDAIYAEYLQLRPPDVDLCLRFGDALATRGLHTRAVFFYQLALQVRPDHALTYARLAAVLARDGDLANALACCRQAILLQADESQFHAQLGDLLAADGQSEAAISAFRRGLELDPDQPALYRQLGDLLVKAGRVEAAADAYAQAIAQGYQHY